MNTFFEFLNALGGLHDATLVAIEWQLESQTLRFEIDDLYANFRGLPEYPGIRKGTIVLKGLSQTVFNVVAREQLRVYEFLPEENQPSTVTLKLSPGGYITAQFDAVEHPTNELLHSN